MSGLKIEMQELTPEMIEKKRPKGDSVIKYITPQQLYRIRQDVQIWRLALTVAESVVTPNRTELYRGYQDALLDPHIKTVIDQRHAEVMAKPFEVVDENGEPSEEWTMKFNRNPMHVLYKQMLTSIEWGFTLVQFGDIEDDTFTKTKIVPREYVKPELGIVAKHPSNNEGVSFEEGKFSLWTLPVGTEEDKGLFLSIMPFYIYKKNTVGSWAEYSEIFGQPTRVLRTDQQDQDKREANADQLANMGSSGFAMIGMDEELILTEANTGSGYSTYQDLADFADKQVSKLVLGQTMTTDEGSSRSQSETHKSTLSARIAEDCWFLEATVNDVLIPKMRNLGVAIPEGYKFKIVDKEKVDPEKKFQRVIELKKAGFNIPADYITEQFNIPVEDAPTPTALGGAQTPPKKD